jgi:hypothetical protein
MKLFVSILISFAIVGGCVKPVTGNTSTTSDSSSTNGTTSSASSTSMKGVEQVIFGKFCGRCRGGDCSPMYKLDLVNKQISLDNSNHYSQGEPLVFGKTLGDIQYQIAEKLLNSIPDSLYTTTETRYGCPNCADQCGFYLELNKADKTYKFEIDTDLHSLNGGVKDLSELLMTITGKLRESNTLEEAR